MECWIGVIPIDGRQRSGGSDVKGETHLGVTTFGREESDRMHGLLRSSLQAMRIITIIMVRRILRVETPSASFREPRHASEQPRYRPR